MPKANPLRRPKDQIVLLAMACVILLVDLMVKGRLRTPTYLMSLLTLAVVAALTSVFAQDGKTIYGFGGLDYKLLLKKYLL